MNNNYNNRGNNNIFDDYSISQENVKKPKKQYKVNKIFGDETEINEKKIMKKNIIIEII